MYIPFNNLTPESKIWIYQCNRLLKVEEQEFIANKMLDFVNNWQAHGTDLKASFEIQYNHFLVIGVDEKDQNATGCSIDASVHTLQSIQQELDVDLFDRMGITYKKEDNKVVCRTRKEFKELIARGEGRRNNHCI